MFHAKYLSSISFGFLQEDFSRFFKRKSFGCHGNLSSLWNLSFLTTLVELYARNIPAKFQQIWPSGLGEEVV
jgi:hypothetical protein